jgi:hypothetical protein
MKKSATMLFVIRDEQGNVTKTGRGNVDLDAAHAAVEKLGVLNDPAPAEGDPVHHVAPDHVPPPPPANDPPANDPPRTARKRSARKRTR